MPNNRRRSERQAVGFYVDQFVDDQPVRCFTTDLSPIGLYMERPLQALHRSSNVVQLQLELPEGGEPIWAAAEVVYDRLDALIHGTAVCFTAMADAHRKRLRDWLSRPRPSRLARDPRGAAAQPPRAWRVHTGGRRAQLRLV